MDIKRSLAYSKRPLEPNGTPLTRNELRTAYGHCVAGTIVYFGVNDLNRNLTAFDQNSVPWIEDWILNSGAGEEFTVVVGAEPIQPDGGFDDDGRPVGGYGGCFDYVAANLDMISGLGQSLSGLIDIAKASEVTMRCVVRYASEMNKGPGNVYSGRDDKFRETWSLVRQVLKGADSRILMSFSPGIGTFDTSDIDRYWPGDALVDLVGCTWYYNGHPEKSVPFDKARADNLLSAAKRHFDDYVRRFGPRTSRICIDELGASRDKFDPNVSNSDAVANLRAHLENLDVPGVALEHVSYFFADVWGRGIASTVVCQ